MYNSRFIQDAIPGALLLSTCAGICSGLGGLLAVTLSGSNLGLERLSLWQGAIAALLLVSGGFDLLPEAAAGIPLSRALIFFTIGFSSMFIIGQIVRSIANGALHQNLGAELGVSGYIVFVCLSLHNLLEGISICLAVHEGLGRGLKLATAVGLENIPEGISISLPLYYATNNKGTAIRLAVWSGMVEPLGVLLAGVLLRNWLTQSLVSSLVACVAGIMVYVAVIEMLPAAMKNVGDTRLAALSAWLGMGILSASLVQPLLLYHGRVGSVA